MFRAPFWLRLFLVANAGLMFGVAGRLAAAGSLLCMLYSAFACFGMVLAFCRR